jgi:hypothetical protein
MIFMFLPFEMVWRGTVGRVCKDFARILDCARVRRCMRDDRWERYSHGMPPTVRLASKVLALAVAPSGVYVALDRVIVLMSATGAVLRTIRYDQTGCVRVYALAVRGDELFAACYSTVYPTTTIYGWSVASARRAVMRFGRVARVSMCATDTSLFVLSDGCVYELAVTWRCRRVSASASLSAWGKTTLECGEGVEVFSNASSPLLIATIDDVFAGYAVSVHDAWHVNADSGHVNAVANTRSFFVTSKEITREVEHTYRHVAVHKGVIFTGGKALCMW